MAYADRLTERIDALADALRDAGVASDRIALVMSSAATATMHALVLDAVLEDGHACAPAGAEQSHASQPLRVAA